MDIITCPTCNPANTRGSRGELISGPGILRTFASQAIVCPTCFGSGLLGVPGAQLFDKKANIADGGTPNWAGEIVSELPDIPIPALSGLKYRGGSPHWYGGSLVPIPVTSHTLFISTVARAVPSPVGLLKRVGRVRSLTVGASASAIPSVSMLVRRPQILVVASMSASPSVATQRRTSSTTTAGMTAVPSVSMVRNPQSPLTQIAQIKQTTPVSSLTLHYPYNVGPGSQGFQRPIATGNSLFLYVLGDGATAANLLTVSGGGAAAWAYPLSASKAQYGRNTLGGQQSITFTLNDSQTFSALLAEFSGNVLVEPFTDDYAGGAGPATPSLTPATVAVTMVAVFQISGTGKTISNPTNGFIFYPGCYVDNGINGLVMTYMIDSNLGVAINTGITVTP